MPAPSRPRRGLTRLGRGWTGPRLAAFGCGGLPLAVFPRIDLGMLAWVILVPGLMVLRAAPTRREAAVRGWWFGAGFVIVQHTWLVPNIGPGLLVAGLALGAPGALLGLLARETLRAPLTPARALAALPLVPSAWLVLEILRSWHALGGPWALLGASQWRHPAVLALAAVGGVWLVGAVLVAANTAAVVALTGRGPAVRLLGVAAAALAAAAGPVTFAVRDEPAARRHLTVALVQPGVMHGPPARLAAEEELTRRVVPARPDLVAWGESSVGMDLERRPDLVARLGALAAASGGQLLVNEDAAGADGAIAKASVLLDAGGVRGRYVKTRLVPFGEYIPLRPALGWLASVSEAAGRDRVPGTGVALLAARDRAGRPLPLGVLVCFESAFPDMSRVAAARGAQLLLYQSATSTFQGSAAPAQHASLAAVRAAETGRPAVQAALTGVSAAFDGRGRRLAWLETDRRGVLVVRLDLPGSADATPYVRHGDHVPRVAAGLVLAALLAGVWDHRRRESPGPRRPSPGTGVGVAAQ